MYIAHQFLSLSETACVEQARTGGQYAANISIIRACTVGDAASLTGSYQLIVAAHECDLLNVCLHVGMAHISLDVPAAFCHHAGDKAALVQLRPGSLRLLPFPAAPC